MMDEPATIQPPAAPPTRRGGSASLALAWLAILACVGYSLWEVNKPAPVAPQEASTAPQSRPADDHPLQEPLENAARITLGLSEWFGPNLRPWFLEQAALLQEEGPKERMVYAIMAADLVGLDEAHKELDKVASDDSKKWVAHSQTDLRLLDILDRLYSEARPPSAQSAAPALIDDDRAFLETQLHWFGRFAPLARGYAGDTPQRDDMVRQSRIGPVAIVGFIAWIFLCGCVGLGALIVLLVRALTGRLNHGFGGVSGHGRAYAEGFAIFMAVFTAVHLLREAFGSLFDSLPTFVLLGLTIVMQFAGFFGALLWAKHRVGSWATLKRDVGLHTGRGLVREIATGLLTYCCAIPMVAIGFLLTITLLAVQKALAPDAPPPTHPAQEMLKSAGGGATAMIFVLAVIIAPIIEETVFRGMLYRHLREATARWGLALSVLASALWSSLLFGAIHPQGWPVIPALASLAVAFCLAREWRGSLIPGMVAHGISNGIVLGLGLVVFRG